MVLQEKDVALYSESKCESLSNSSKIICMDLNNVGKGDSGGPLVVVDNGIKYLSGITSAHGAFMVYTKVEAYSSWINSKVKLSGYNTTDNEDYILVTETAPSSDIASLKNHISSLKTGWHMIGSDYVLTKTEMIEVFGDTVVMAVSYNSSIDNWNTIEQIDIHNRNYSNFRNIAAFENFWVYVR